MSSSVVPRETQRVTVNQVGEDGSSFSKTIVVRMDDTLAAVKDMAYAWAEESGIDVEARKKLSLLFHADSGLLLSDATTLAQACEAVNHKCGTKFGKIVIDTSGKPKRGKKALPLHLAELLLPSAVSKTAINAAVNEMSHGTAAIRTRTSTRTRTSEVFAPSGISVPVDKCSTDIGTAAIASSTTSESEGGTEATVVPLAEERPETDETKSGVADASAEHRSSGVAEMAAMPLELHSSAVFLGLVFEEYEKKLSSFSSMAEELAQSKKNEGQLKRLLQEYKDHLDHLTDALNAKGVEVDTKMIEATSASKGSRSKISKLTGLKKGASKRRESRVHVVQLKIDNELSRGRNPKAVIRYEEDSPFWWRKLRESHLRIKRLTSRLMGICSLMDNFCDLLDNFSDHCGDLYHSVKLPWQEAEGELSSEILSLNSQFNELGEEFAHMSSATQQLGLTFRAVFIVPFREFIQTQFPAITLSYKKMKHVGSEYEKVLKELLRAPKKLATDIIEEMEDSSTTTPSTTTTLSTSSSSGKKGYVAGAALFLSKVTGGVSSKKKRKKSLLHSEMTEAEYEALLVKVSQRRREYELKRFDHCQLVNEVIHRHRQDLIVSICACFHGFETFFHVGYEGALAHKNFMRSVQKGVMDKTQDEEEKGRNAQKKRTTLEGHLTFGVAAAQSGKHADNVHKVEFEGAGGQLSPRHAFPVSVGFGRTPLSATPEEEMDGMRVAETSESLSASATHSESASASGGGIGDDTLIMKTTSLKDHSSSGRSAVPLRSATGGTMEAAAAKKKKRGKDPYDVDSWSGYMWKQSSSMRKDWKRRWFVLENGELAYYRSRDKMDRELMVNTMLCKVRDKADTELRYVFEVVTPTRRIYTLQCENSSDLMAWTSVLKNQPARMLRRSSAMSGGDMRTSAMEQRRRKTTLTKRIQEMNDSCCDCGKQAPEWLSINTGALVCISCGGVHRSLGTHVSKVRSLVLDEIDEVSLEVVCQIGNLALNSILEFNILSGYTKCDEDATMHARERYIKAKYSFRMFVDSEFATSKSYEELNADLWLAAAANDMMGILKAIFYGANVDSRDASNCGRSALHVAAMKTNMEAIELLLQNGADFDLRDDTGKSVRDLVAESGAAEATSVMTMLDSHDPSYGKTFPSADASEDSTMRDEDSGTGDEDELEMLP